jgi:glucosylceramidase
MADTYQPPLFDGGNPFGEGSAPPTVHVYQTSRSAGQGGAPDHMADEGTIPVTSMPASGVTTVTVDLTQPRQQVVGFGAAITEAVASLVTSLSTSQQQQILNDYWGPNGSGYVLTRTHIGSCDFALAPYTYDDSTSPDPTLSQFSISHDMTYLIPFLKQAMTASGGNLKILSSPWTAPAWMKNGNSLIGPGQADGTLLPQYYGAYAQYFSKYLQAYAAQGLKIWAITTQNEANGVGGSREGMQWLPSQMNTFIRDNLGPQFKTDGVSDTLVYFFDHNKDPIGSNPPEALAWAQTVLYDQTTNPMVAGTAVHWYDSTFQTYPDELDAVHAVDPSKGIIYTEGTADGLGDVAYGQSSAGFKYSWMSDDYYWTYDGYDWGYWYTQPPQKNQHPVYEPVYRYIRDIIVGLNHWYIGFIDWNAVLNRDGGPGHIVNPVPAAIMVDTSTNPNNLYYTPIFYAMQQFSKFIRPQATVVPSTVNLASGVSMNDYNGQPTQDGAALIAAAAVNTDGSIAVVLFNETSSAIPYSVTIGSNSANETIPGQAMQTLVWK